METKMLNDAMDIRRSIENEVVRIMAKYGVRMAPGSPDKARGHLIFGVGLWSGHSDKVQISRSPHASEGTGTKTVTLQKGLENGEPSAALIASIERMARDLAAMLARDDAIRRHGHILRPPGWSYVMHSLPLAVIRSEVPNPVAAMLPYDIMKDYIPQPTATGISLAIGRLRQFEGSIMEARRDRIVCCPLVFRLGDERFRFVDVPEPMLQAERLQLPASVMSSIAGERLADVIAHPLLTGMDIRIKKVVMVPNEVTSPVEVQRMSFVLAKSDERLEPMPPGETGDWRIPAR